jgi:hypothetical protein
MDISPHSPMRVVGSAGFANSKRQERAAQVSAKEARDKEGRPYSLLAEGEPIKDLF